jgi:uncharacterized membrane protein HdeD (DUF308 family)
MMSSNYIDSSKRISWKVYLGVGILSALAGYVFSAVPQLIGLVLFLGLAVWLISSGMRERGEGSVTAFWRNRGGKLRYGAQS